MHALRRSPAPLDRGVAAIVLAACVFASACAPRVLHIQRHIEVFESVPDGDAIRAALAPPEGTPPPCDADELRSQWVYAPDPDYAVIARAWPRRTSELTTTVSYCITERGKTDAIELVQRSGVTAIDDAVMRSIATWRAKPHIIFRRPVRACETSSFEIRIINPGRRR
ncbi:MAG: TonB C-terminal domain-containing protein [Myxococcales bacterium]|nr:TonB C-terminal domain-containing protein [Myxococcales bacterium]MCB9570156.1 TonB C-terminal domain-containing protein [Myxococcales bacterium]MCB9705175.1 TonB C-terminal domain-containing protein [Myxococcales bacterium]